MIKQIKTKYYKVLLFYSLPIISQNIQLKDIETKENISYATVIYMYNDKTVNYDYANEDGYFSLKKDLNYNKLVVSCLGYENKFLEKEFLSDTLFLKRKYIALNEVVINNKDNTKLLGYLNEKEKMKIGFSKGLEISMYFENLEGKEIQLKSFLFYLRQKFSEKTAVRFHIYELSTSNFEPGIEISNENIVHIIDLKNNNAIEIDLSSHNITLPINGAFIGIEFLGYLDEKQNTFRDINYKENFTDIKFNDKIDLPLTFIRNCVKKEKWTNTNFLKSELRVMKKFKNVPNASFGIKVYTE